MKQKEKNKEEKRHLKVKRSSIDLYLDILSSLSRFSLPLIIFTVAFSTVSPHYILIVAFRTKQLKVIKTEIIDWPTCCCIISSYLLFTSTDILPLFFATVSPRCVLIASLRILSFKCVSLLMVTWIPAVYFKTKAHSRCSQVLFLLLHPCFCISKFCLSFSFIATTFLQANIKPTFSKSHATPTGCKSLPGILAFF